MQLSPKGKPASRWMALQIVMTVQQVGRANGSPIGHPTQIGASAARGSGQDSATAALTVKCRWIDGHLRGRRRGAAARRRRTTSAGGQRDGGDQRHQNKNGSHQGFLPSIQRRLTPIAARDKQSPHRTAPHRTARASPDTLFRTSLNSLANFRYPSSHLQCPNTSGSEAGPRPAAPPKADLRGES